MSPTEDIARGFRTGLPSINNKHAQFVLANLEMAANTPPQPEKHLSKQDVFSRVQPRSVAGTALPREDVVRLKLKQYGKASGYGTKNAPVIKMPLGALTTSMKAVPPYTFHHIEISQNMLAPSVPTQFIPHPPNMDAEQEAKHNEWLAQLAETDEEDGLAQPPSSPAELMVANEARELAMTVALYTTSWLRRCSLNVAKIDKMIKLLADDGHIAEAFQTLSPRTESATAREDALEIFEEYWYNEVAYLSGSRVTVTGDPVRTSRRVKSRSNKQERFGEITEQDELIEAVQQDVDSYTKLACLICHMHVCEHGDHQAEDKNEFNMARIDQMDTLFSEKLAFSTRSGARDSTRYSLTENAAEAEREASRKQDGGSKHQRPWIKDEVTSLENVYVMMSGDKVGTSQVVAKLLDRDREDVCQKLSQLHLADSVGSPKIDRRERGSLPWYDRYQKTLSRNWQTRIVTHQLAGSSVQKPCSHNGPCDADCPCVRNKRLCEKLCRCTLEACPRKFNGCGCHSVGQSCSESLDDDSEPCICLQLNRECDPSLCMDCGSLARADPRQADNDQLHSTGCQNISLQRGQLSMLYVGESTIEGCGYGLFAGEAFEAGEYVTEYIGEVIGVSEGERRQARAGNSLENSHLNSYLFTLLEADEVWIDSAKYGNLSRYANHASERDGGSPNISPEVKFVNHDYRIKFVATQKIKVGDELFFDYGENYNISGNTALDQSADTLTRAQAKTSRLSRETFTRVKERSTVPKHQSSSNVDDSTSNYRLDQRSTSRDVAYEEDQEDNDSGEYEESLAEPYDNDAEDSPPRKRRATVGRKLRTIQRLRKHDLVARKTIPRVRRTRVAVATLAGGRGAQIRHSPVNESKPAGTSARPGSREAPTGNNTRDELSRIRQDPSAVATSTRQPLENVCTFKSPPMRSKAIPPLAQTPLKSKEPPTKEEFFPKHGPYASIVISSSDEDEAPRPPAPRRATAAKTTPAPATAVSHTHPRPSPSKLPLKIPTRGKAVKTGAIAEIINVDDDETDIDSSPHRVSKRSTQRPVRYREEGE